MALDWKIFTQRPYIKSLPLEEQTRLFYIANEKSIRYRSRSGGEPGPTFINAFALNFDGIDDQVDLADGGHDLGINSTISIWVNPDSGYNGILLGEDGYSFDYLLYPYSTGFFVRIAGTAKNYTDVPTYLTAGSWHHLAIVRSGDSIEVFVDGVSRGTNTGFATSNGMRFDTIGAKPNGNSPFEGKVDEVAGFDSTFTDDQVVLLYNNGKPGDLTSLNPVAWYRFEEGSGTIANDIGSADKTGTINGATYSTNVPS